MPRKLKLPPEFELAKTLPGTSAMERVRAARAMLNTRLDSDRLRLAAFLSIFHPEMPEDQARSLIMDASDQVS